MEGVANLINLSELHINHNKLTTLKGIEKMTNLIKIVYNNNNPLPKHIIDKSWDGDIKGIQQYYRTHD